MFCRDYIDFEDTTALDLFAGTGSISLELVSRGCSRVISVEADRDHANFITRVFQETGRRQGSSDSRRCIPFSENLQAEV